NDWHIDEWCGSYPGRFIPLAVGPLWDRDALVTEIHRVAAKGCTAMTLPETPYGVGLPSFYTDHWDPVFAAMCDTHMAVCMHFLGCFITDPSALHLAERIGVDSIAWECDYPHSDSTWPRSPEYLLEELTAANLSDEVINKMTWQNACRFFRFDPFPSRAKSEA